MDFQEIIDRALIIRKLYEEREKRLYGAAWTTEEIALGLVGDVGDLAKLVVAENGKRDIEHSKEKLEHEISDCLWSLIVLARIHNIDLEQSFLNAMDNLENHLRDRQDWT